ncbi:MAG: acetamidase/formamidase family protein [Chloroflexi bacterium]|nr:acetamidase/formamidase family protein [Chloroflexota bacterium]
MSTSAAAHFLDDSIIHQVWDNSLSPRLEIDSGEVVTFQIRGGANNYFTPQSTHQDVPHYSAKGHALNGPVAVRGALPGDVLQIEILALQPWDWGYTKIAPGYGLLPEDFPEPYLKIWDLSHGTMATFKPGIEVPLEPFCGVMGVAPAEPGEHSTMPPRRVGGNLDVKQLTVGSTLWLPIEVEGALFSVGDAHAAQGDGEVCVTAIETGMTATLRLSLRRDFRLAAPELRTSGPLLAKTNAAGWHATTGVAPDLMAATRAATRNMIRYLGRAHGLSPEEAYVLCSVAVDLKISEVVGAPNWVVSAFLPLSIFREDGG